MVLLTITLLLFVVWSSEGQLLTDENAALQWSQEFNLALADVTTYSWNASWIYNTDLTDDNLQKQVNYTVA